MELEVEKKKKFVCVLNSTISNMSRVSSKSNAYTECSLNIVFFPRIIKSLPPLPRQLSAAIGCTKNYQPIGVTVHSHCVESFEGLLLRCRREGGVAVNCEKTQFFLNTLYYRTRGFKKGKLHFV